MVIETISKVGAFLTGLPLLLLTTSCTHAIDADGGGGSSGGESSSTEDSLGESQSEVIVNSPIRVFHRTAVAPDDGVPCEEISTCTIPLKMLPKNEWVCTLGGVTSEFRGSSDWAAVEVHNDGFWYLHVNSREAVAATANCFQLRAFTGPIPKGQTAPSRWISGAFVNSENGGGGLSIVASSRAQPPR